VKARRDTSRYQSIIGGSVAFAKWMRGHSGRHHGGFGALLHWSNFSSVNPR